MRSAAFHMTADAAASLVVAARRCGHPGRRPPQLGRPRRLARRRRAHHHRGLPAPSGQSRVLLESSPADVDLAALTSTMAAVPGVAEVHDLHVWSISSEIRALSAHVVVVGHPSLEQAQAIGDKVKSAVAEPFTIAHATLELECERCTDEESDPCLMDSLSEPAAITPR